MAHRRSTGNKFLAKLSPRSRVLWDVKRHLLLLALTLFANVRELAGAAEPLVLRTLDGREHRPLDDKLVKATLLLFVAHDCPISNASAPEFNRIAEQYGRAGVACFLVYAEPEMLKDKALGHAADFRIKMPVIADGRLELAARAGAKVTPEAVLFDSAGEVVYRGRIDDTHMGLMSRREEPTTRYLRDALDAVLAGKAVRVRETVAIGCFIPFDLKKP